MNETMPIEIAICCFPGYQATAAHGLTDLFTYANFFAQAHEKEARPTGDPKCPAGAEAATPPLRIRHWGEHPETGRIECLFDTLPGAARAPDIVIVPASQIAPMEQGRAPAWVEHIRARHGEGAVVAAVCGGVFLLAETGLLRSRRATTHWMFAEELGRRHPDILVQPDRLVIDDGDLVTAGGVLAWADLGLSLVERFLGPTAMRTTAHFMLFDASGREQRMYSNFSPPLRHGDRAILAVQHFMQTQLSGALTVEALAGRARLGERTFLRRFGRATGMSPGEYLQRLRVARTREMLEFTSDTVEQIASAVGYEDTGGLRKAFRRVVGLSPSQYRLRFGRTRARETGDRK